MQKYNFILILLLFQATVTYSQATDCTKFREGKFKTADSRVGAIVISDRRGRFQTESTDALKLVIRFNITWQDNCTYTLTLDKILRNENKIDIPASLAVKVKILETLAGSYIQEVSSTITNGAYKTEVIKIE